MTQPTKYPPEVRERSRHTSLRRSLTKGQHARLVPVPSPRLVYDQLVSDAALLDRIVVNPDVAGGRATIRGHRIWVSLVLGLLADGMTVSEVIAEYRGLEDADVRACIAYGARLASGPFVDVA